MLFEICRQEPSASFSPLYLNAVLIRPSCRVVFLFECFDVFVSCDKLVFEVSFFFMGFVVLDFWDLSVVVDFFSSTELVEALEDADEKEGNFPCQLHHS